MTTFLEPFEPWLFIPFFPADGMKGHSSLIWKSEIA